MEKSPEYGLPSGFPPHHVGPGICVSDAFNAYRVHICLQVVFPLLPLEPDPGRVEDVEGGAGFPRAAGEGVVERQALEPFPVGVL